MHGGLPLEEELLLLSAVLELLEVFLGLVAQDGGELPWPRLGGVVVVYVEAALGKLTQLEIELGETSLRGLRVDRQILEDLLFCP